MRAEIIAVGTELLMGQIVNTNAQYLSRELASLGIGVYWHTVVGDNAERIAEAIRTARSRADLVVTTGGLGPTRDDLTKEVMARVLGRELKLYPPALEKIEAHFRARGQEMPESNRRQALMMEGSTPLPNDVGHAVGEALEEGGALFVLLPGPPRELQPMFEKYAKPWLAKMNPELPIYSKMLKFSGIGESLLEQRLLDLIDTQTDPMIAPYAKEGEVAVRLSTRAATYAEAERKWAAVERTIRERVGEFLYAEEDIPIEAAVVRLLTARNETLAVAESCSGGLLAHLVTNVPGSSRVFIGGIVCYDKAVKRDWLHVPDELLRIDGPGEVSEQTALRLAENTRSRFRTDWALSVTGVAGPAELEGKPPGLVYVGVAGPGGSRAFEEKWTGNRETIKWRAAKAALYRLWRCLR